MSDRIIAFFVVPHGSGWAPSVLAGDGVALLVAMIGERLAVVDEGFLQSDVLAVGLGDLIAEGGLRVRVVRQVLEGGDLALGGFGSGKESEERIFFRLGKVPVSAMVWAPSPWVKYSTNL